MGINDIEEYTLMTTSGESMASNTNHYDDLFPNPCGINSSDTAKREADKFI